MILLSKEMTQVLIDKLNSLVTTGTIVAAVALSSTYVNTLPQCSPASMGLAQARPNKQTKVQFV